MQTSQAGPEQIRAVATKVSMVSILGNLLLTVFKLAAGILACSGAMISDAVHSASDVISSFIVIIGVRIAAKAPDEGHPYGHERFECVAAMVLAAILVLAGGGIGIEAVRKIAGAETLSVPGTLALVAAAVSIVAKEGMFWYTRKHAKLIDSTALMAEAWHHRSDALSSVGALIGIAGARMGFPILEPVASLIICLLVLKVAVEVFKDAMDRIVDHACDAEMEAQIRQCAESQEGVLGVDLLHTRMFGNKVYVDLEISADGSLSLVEGHAIAERVHAAVEKQFPQVKHIMVHVNPGE